MSELAAAGNEGPLPVAFGSVLRLETELNASVAAAGAGAGNGDDGWLETESKAGAGNDAGAATGTAAGAGAAGSSGVAAAGAEATGGTLEMDVKFWPLACAAQPSSSVANRVRMKARCSIGRRL
jgi:hypothetical protein